MKKRLPAKVIIDSNIYISATLGGIVKQQFSMLLDATRIKIYTCSKQLLEIDIALEKPYLKQHIPLAGIEALKVLLKYGTTSILLISEVDICRDKKDNYLLALCCDTNSDYLITSDKDLLVLNSYQKCKITSLKDFIDDFFS
jgi:uncharacterized protein